VVDVCDIAESGWCARIYPSSSERIARDAADIGENGRHVGQAGVKDLVDIGDLCLLPRQ
jgi:hypothetical protein